MGCEGGGWVKVILHVTLLVCLDTEAPVVYLLEDNDTFAQLGSAANFTPTPEYLVTGENVSVSTQDYPSSSYGDDPVIWANINDTESIFNSSESVTVSRHISRTEMTSQSLTMELSGSFPISFL